MKVINGFLPIKDLSLALGFFDGVHIGHSVVIKNAVKYAKQNNCKSGIVLFRVHPQEFFSNKKFEYIIEFNDKIDLFNKLGADYVFILDFDEKIAKITASEYIEKFIIPNFSPKAITTGYNHTFGFCGEGNSETLKKYSKLYNFQYFEIPPITNDLNTISSTSIRSAIKGSDFEQAKSMLGYNFYIKSPVIHGKQIGRTINFPTANLIYPQNIVEIEKGVYFVEVQTYSKKYRGIMNFGYRPTVDKKDKILIPEVNLLDFSGNLYGHIIKVSFIAKIRDEQPFKSLSELKNQLTKDAEFAKQYPL